MAPWAAGVVGFFAGYIPISLIFQTLFGSPFGLWGVRLAGFVSGFFLAWFMYRAAHRRRDEGLDFAQRKNQDKK